MMVERRGFFDLKTAEPAPVIAAPTRPVLRRPIMAAPALAPAPEAPPARPTTARKAIRNIEPEAERLEDDITALVAQLRRIADMHSTWFWSRYLLETSDTIEAQQQALLNLGLPDEQKVANSQRISLGSVKDVYRGIREVLQSGGLANTDRFMNNVVRYREAKDEKLSE